MLVTERYAYSATSRARPAAPGFLASGAWAAAGAVACAVLGPLLARSGLVPSGIGEGLFRGAVPVRRDRRGDGDPVDATLAAGGSVG